MARYNGHEVAIEEQEGQCARIVGVGDVTVSQEGEEEGGWVFIEDLEDYEA
jgi:hypothetical protein